MTVPSVNLPLLEAAVTARVSRTCSRSLRPTGDVPASRSELGALQLRALAVGGSPGYDLCSALEGQALPRPQSPWGALGQSPPAPGVGSRPTMLWASCRARGSSDGRRRRRGLRLLEVREDHARAVAAVAPLPASLAVDAPAGFCVPLAEARGLVLGGHGGVTLGSLPESGV